MNQNCEASVLFLDFVLCCLAAQLQNVVGIVEFIVEKSCELIFGFDWFMFDIGSEGFSDLFIELGDGFGVHFIRVKEQIIIVFCCD